MALEPKDVVSIVATISTIVLFLTGIQICMRIRRQGSTKNISIFPFIASAVSCTLWLKYGILREDITLIVVNTVGAILESLYCMVYYLNTYERGRVHGTFLLSCLIVFPVLTYVKFYLDDLNSALSQLGLICCCCTITMYGSPLGTVADVFRTKSTASMAFPLSLANFLVSLEWGFYGHMVKDNFITVPNAIGTLLGFFQLILFYCYASSPPTGNQATVPVRNV